MLIAINLCVGYLIMSTDMECSGLRSDGPHFLPCADARIHSIVLLVRQGQLSRELILEIYTGRENIRV